MNGKTFKDSFIEFRKDVAKVKYQVTLRVASEGKAKLLKIAMIHKTVNRERTEISDEFKNLRKLLRITRFRNVL